MIEVSDLTRWLDIATPTDAEMLLLNDLETRAVAFIERQANRHFGASQTFVETFTGLDSSVIWLNESPASITQVRTRAWVGDTWVIVATGDDDGWELRGRRLMRKSPFVWTTGYEIEVTYDFGYTAGQEPSDIRQLVFDLVKLKWDLRTDAAGVAAEKVGPHSITYAQGTFTGELAQIPWVADTLDSWRRLEAA